MCLWVSYPIELDMYSQAHQTHAQNPPYGSSQPPDESSHPTINIQHVKKFASDSTWRATLYKSQWQMSTMEPSKLHWAWKGSSY